MKRADQVTGVVLFLASLHILQQSTTLEMTYRNTPGSGFFPFWLSAGAALVSLAILVGGLRRPAALDRPIRWPSGLGLRRIAVSSLAIVGYAFLIKWLGYILSTTLLVGFVARLLGGYRWHQLLILGVTTSVGLYVVFHVWLQMTLPTGMLPIP
jgi:putative tricarboxylic transport membrane protein